MKVQSEHWSSNQCTLLIMVWQWLDVATWNKEEGPLCAGAEVTVNGEKAGEARKEKSFWATVTAGPQRAAGSAVDMYVAEDAAGVPHTYILVDIRVHIYIRMATGLRASYIKP